MSPFFTENYIPESRRKAEKKLVFAHYAIVTPDIFCKVKNGPNLFSVGASSLSLWVNLRRSPDPVYRPGKITFQFPFPPIGCGVSLAAVESGP